MNPQEHQQHALIPVSDGQNSPAPRQEQKKKTGYWARVAARYTATWRTVLVITVLFVILFALLFSRAFTYDSMYCFFRDLKAVSAFAPSDYKTVSTAFKQGDVVSLPYRGGVAVVNSGGVEVYTPNGERLLNVSRSFKNPRAVASRKYLLAYDNGGKTFSVTNSYTELFHGESEYPILGATVSDSGHFALITASGDALSQVLLYDGYFNLIQRFQRASATVGVSLSEDGKRILLLGMTAENGTARSVLSLFKLGADEPEISMVYDKEIPLSAGFTKHKNYTVLTDTGLRCYDADGDLRTEIDVREKTPVGFTVCEDGVLLVQEVDEIHATHQVLVLDEKGKVLYDGTYDRDVKALALTDKVAYLLSDAEVVRIDTKEGEQQSFAVESGAMGIFAIDEDRIRVVYPAKITYIELARRR